MYKPSLLDNQNMIYNHSEEADIKIHLKASYTLYQGHRNKIKEL